jgi:hypothetical protein
MLGGIGVRALNHYDVRLGKKVFYPGRDSRDSEGPNEGGRFEGRAGPRRGLKKLFRNEKRGEWCAKCKIRRVDTFGEGL